jgi:hypothetical protein
MNAPMLYRGVWPQNVSKLAKYGVRFFDGAWRITVLYEAGDGLRFLAVEGSDAGLVDLVNAVKTAIQGQPGGAFYVNEYGHVIVPVADSTSGVPMSSYYFAGRIQSDLQFDFEGRELTTRPVRSDGSPLTPGARWFGPRPGIPYVLAAGAKDVYYETPALTDNTPPAVRPMMTRKVLLSRVVGDNQAVRHAVEPIARIRGYQGGRFYVNEHGAMFTPVDAGDGNGIDYIYCGQIDYEAWFPEPEV